MNMSVGSGGATFILSNLYRFPKKLRAWRGSFLPDRIHRGVPFNPLLGIQ